MGTVVRVAAILAAAFAAGLTNGRLRGVALVPDVRQILEQRRQHQSWREQTAIDLEAFRQHFEVGFLVIDARPREQFEQGHLDAPMVMNIPAEEAADGFHIERVLPYLGQPIVIYCASEACDSAETLWRVLRAWGFGSEVRVYHPGWEGMVAAGLPVARGPDMTVVPVTAEPPVDAEGGGGG
jgi:rhodanese-related sulfurtransferase